MTLNALLAATYREQNELQQSHKYEALFTKPYQNLGIDVDLDEFLRLVLGQDSKPEFGIGPTITIDELGTSKKDD